VACVDSGGRHGGTGTMVAPTCAAMPPAPYMGGAVIPSEDTADPGPYAWNSVVIKGGGFVSGIIMSPAMQGLAYARTDVGGAYRYDPANRRWMAITDWVGHNDGNLTGIESIAADPVDPNRVYIAAGQYTTAGNGMILSSTDMGRHWTKNSIGAPMGGNVDGRSMGERLVVDPNLPSTLYFGSRNAGLFVSTDSAQTWSRVDALKDDNGQPVIGATSGGVGMNGGAGYGLTFVAFDARSGSPGSPTPAIYVGVGVLTGTNLYRSLDAGATWQPVGGQPPALMPHHAVADGCGNLFFAYNSGSGPNGITSGYIWRYDTMAGTWKDVSPPPTAGGFGGISADPSHPGTFVVTTMDNWSPGEIFRTNDGGTSWTKLYAASQHDVSGANWLYWHGSSLPAAGWMGDVEIDPFNPSRALYITGQGLWSTDNLTDADARGGSTTWSFEDAGLEETVALDLASPSAGAPLLSGVGDIGGFKHDDLGTSPADGMSANPIFGNTNSLDYAEGAPMIVARVGTNSTSGGARGAYSMDGGSTWIPFATAPGTNASSGSIAVSSDGATFVWSPSRVGAAYSRNNGATWTAACFMVPPATTCSTVNGVKLASDRMNASKFYATSTTRVYVSTDGGANFTQVTLPFTVSNLGRPRPALGVEGELWATTNTGLIRSGDSGATWTQVPQVNAASAVGFGAPAPNLSHPALYVAGAVLNMGSYTWGVYRSDNAVEVYATGDDLGRITWQRIDDPGHQFGYVNILAGDPRQYGRVYLGTGGRGILYGDPRPQ
jgi:xyloglucan-specific exo-beta-1,4-glucanase